MVYIPYLMFARFQRNRSPEIEDIEIYARWSQLLAYYPRDKADWTALKNEYGTLLRYNWTNWTPRGRKERPVRRPT